MKKIIYLILLILLTSSCKTYSDDDKKNFDTQINSYLKKYKIKNLIRSKSGLYYKIIQEGKGKKIQYSDNVSFSYRGKLLNGTTVDFQKKPITFAVKDLITGWKEILLNSKAGAKVFMILPPSLGYGENDLDNIPPNSVLIFDMEIVKVQ